MNKLVLNYAKNMILTKIEAKIIQTVKSAYNAEKAPEELELEKIPGTSRIAAERDREDIIYKPFLPNLLH